MIEYKLKILYVEGRKSYKLSIMCIYLTKLLYGIALQNHQMKHVLNI